MNLMSFLKRAVKFGGTHPRDPVLADWWGSSSATAAGISVTPQSALRAAAVFSCVRVIAESVASLPLILYRRLPDGGKERAVNHPLYGLIGRRPNGWQTRFEFVEQGVGHMCLRGATYARIIADRKGVRTLMPLHPDRMRGELLDSGKLAYEYTPLTGGREILLQDEVLRVPFMTLDGIKPLSVIAAQREAIGASLATQDYAARLFANDARPTGGLLSWEVGHKFKDDEAEKAFRKAWQEYMTGENRHKTAILKPGMKYTPIGMTNDDAQFLETRKMQRSEIAGVFRVPPHMIGDLERATFANIEHQAIEFVVHSITPWLVRWEQALSRDLLSDAEQDEYFFEFLIDGLLRGDAKARAEYFKAAILTGWMSRNEVRVIENLNKADGLDDFLAPLNMTPAELLAEQQKEKTP